MSQSEKIITIPANAENMPVRAGGDFIFLKECARDVRVIVDGHPVTMRRGDKRRFDRKLYSDLQAFDSFEVSNPYDVDLRATFVVGRGDYNSQIVTGEIFVSEVYKTTSLQTNKKPVTIAREIGLVSTALYSVSADSNVASIAGTAIYAAIFYRNNLIVIDSGNVKRFDFSGALLGSVAISGLAGGDYIVGMCEMGGRVYIATDQAKIGLLDLVAGRVVVLGGMGAAGQYALGRGLVAYNGMLYIKARWVANKAKHSIFMVDVSSGAPVFSEYIYLSGWSWVSEFNGHFVVGGYGGQVDVAYNIETKQIGGIVNPNLAGTNIAPNWNHAVNMRVESDGFNTYLKYINTKTYKGKVFCQEVGNAGSRIEFGVGADYFYSPRGANIAIGGKVAKLVIDGILLPSGRSAPVDYMDYIIAMNYTDGDYSYEKNAGTATWAYADFDDSGEILLPSEFSVSVMPELLTDVY